MHVSRFLRIFLGLAVVFLLVHCGRNTDFLYFVKEPPTQPHAFKTKIKEMQGYERIDVLWVIDNSGSMMNHQRAVISNTKAFMDNFTTKKGLDWKMGLLSTDQNDGPYVGFTKSEVLDSRTPDPVNTFQNAVGKLGWNRGCPELIFEPVMNNLAKYTDFVRPRAVLAIIAVTDTMEEGPGLQAKFESFLISAKTDLRYIRFYGAFASETNKCANEHNWKYPGSPFEYFVNLTGGKEFALCGKDFGKDLAKVGEDIANSVTYSRIFLKHRPISGTLDVHYQGVPLLGGPKDRGGKWFYDFDRNAILFYDLDFSKKDDDEVEIFYEKNKE